MILKGVATKGVKLFGTEVGAWLSDGINNDFQVIKNLPSHWTTITTGTVGGSATVANDVITLQQGTNSIWMAAYTSITTVIGQMYSVSASTLDIYGGLSDIGAATSIVGSPSTGNMDLGYADATNIGLNTLTFTATGTTTYLYLINGSGAAGYVKFKNEVEIREAEIITGAELVTNGDFATDTAWAKGTGWAISGGNATHATGTTSTIYQSISITSSETYQVVFTISSRTAGYLVVNIGGGDNSAQYSTDGTYVVDIIAGSANGTVGFVAVSAFDGSIDDVSVRLAIPDLSSVNQGLGVYGSLNKHVVNVNADTVSYSGFSASNYLKQPYNSNLDFGTGDFHFRFWVKSTNTAGRDTVFQRYPGSGAYIGCLVESNGNILYDTSSAGLNDSGVNVNDNVWHFIVMQRISGVGEIWSDGVRGFTVVDTGNLTNTTASLYVGVASTASNAADATEIALLKTGPVSLTESQITTIYNKGKSLFERDSVHQVIDSELQLNIERPSAINETPGGVRQSIPSVDGTARESIFERRQLVRSASSGPVPYKTVKYITNFLDAMNEGQAFSYDPYGTVNAPCDPKFVWLESASYAPVRDGDTHWFQTSFTMLERN